jgi:hypothetical protein
VTLLSALLTEDTPLVTLVAVGAFAGLLMGLVVAMITGIFLVQLVQGPRRP